MAFSFVSGFFVHVSWYMLLKLRESSEGSRLPLVSQQVLTLPLLDANSSIRSSAKTSAVSEISVGVKT